MVDDGQPATGIDDYYDLGSFTWPVTTQEPPGPALVRPGDGVVLRLQPRRGHRLLPAGPGARPRPAPWPTGASPTPSAPTTTSPGRTSTTTTSRQSIDLALLLHRGRRRGRGRRRRHRRRAGADRRRWPSASRQVPDEPSGSRRLLRPGTTPTPTPCGPCTGTIRDDLDVCALFAEAVMNRTPWALWDLVTGEPVHRAPAPSRPSRSSRPRSRDLDAARAPTNIPACCTCTST